MSYLIFVAASGILLVSFLLATWLETRQGVRLFARPRRKLDKQVARVSYVVMHIDWAAFFAHVVQSAAERIAHDVVHTTLLIVRATERTLTRVIRSLRERVAISAPDEKPVEGSQLIATIVRFRKNLRREKKEGN
ncbi:MAG: hypothetical protein JWL82_342 [Parcubacteria group bacterium]|nr:hypothetical protein [Parcubacteria group bacterium]